MTSKKVTFTRSDQGRTLFLTAFGAVDIALLFTIVFSIALYLVDTDPTFTESLSTFISLALWMGGLALLLSNRGWQFDDIGSVLLKLFLIGWSVGVPMIILETVHEYLSIPVGAIFYGGMVYLTYTRYVSASPTRRPLEKIIAEEQREPVKEALTKANSIIHDLDRNTVQLRTRKQELEETLVKQKNPHQLEMAIEEARERMQQAKGIGSDGAARTYAFMLTTQKRKLETIQNMATMIETVGTKIEVLQHLREYLTDLAYGLPGEADMAAVMNETINSAMDEVHGIDAFITEISTVEDQLNEAAAETEIADGESSVDVDALPADIRAEIEKELSE